MSIEEKINNAKDWLTFSRDLEARRVKKIVLNATGLTLEEVIPERFREFCRGYRGYFIYNLGNPLPRKVLIARANLILWNNNSTAKESKEEITKVEGRVIEIIKAYLTNQNYQE